MLPIRILWQARLSFVSGYTHLSCRSASDLPTALHTCSGFASLPVAAYKCPRLEHSERIIVRGLTSLHN